MVILIGNLGQDPDSKSLPSGGMVANFTVATSESWKDKATGEQKEKTEWHRIVAFRRLAEVCGEYLRKGSKVYIEGKLQTRKWQDQNGADRYTTEIVANEMQMLDARGSGNQEQPQQRRPAPPPATQPQGDHQQKQTDFDDNIPF